MKKGGTREEDETRGSGRREREDRDYHDASYIQPKEEAELYNATMGTQWHPFYLSTPVLDFPSPSQAHLRTWKLCINITIVPFVAGWCSVIYRCGLMNFLLPPSIYWLILGPRLSCRSRFVRTPRQKILGEGRWLEEGIEEASVGFFIAGSLLNNKLFMKE